VSEPHVARELPCGHPWHIGLLSVLYKQHFPVAVSLPTSVISLVGLVMARAVSTAEARVRARVSPCGICCVKIELRQVFLRDLRFSPASIIPPWLSIPIYRRMNNTTVGGCSSETVCHPTDISNNNIFGAKHVFVFLLSQVSDESKVCKFVPVTVSERPPLWSSG
jgi:hypothetical protein